MQMIHNHILKIFSTIEDAFDKLHLDEVDINISNEVMNIEYNNKIFVINKQSAIQQIWLSSPVSGPHHFSYNTNENSWINKNNKKIFQVIEEDFQALGIKLEF
jgi:iron donor protein CyaY